MAKIKFGMMMTDARGKLGGQVFSKNRSGSYVRTKVTPVNPRTTSQQANRSLLGNLSASWSGLSEDDRNAWNAAVEQWLKTDVFGDSQKPTGKNLFTGLNKNRLALFSGLPIQEVPPSKSVTNNFVLSSGSLVEDPLAYSVVLTGSELNGLRFQFRATPPVTAGTSYYKNLLRGLGLSLVSPANGIIDFTAAYTAIFGELALGSVIFVEVTQVFVTGQKGVPQVIRLVVE